MHDKVVNFDDYVENYESLLKDQLSFFSSKRSYFSLYKVHLMAEALKSRPQNILDFGCGVGLSLPPLIETFPDAQIYASDRSKKSLAYVKNRFSKVTVLDCLEGFHKTFDLIFLSGVIHHVPPCDRHGVMRQIQGLTKPGGQVCIFEHNRYNPVTRRLVSSCPFDKGVVLVSRAELNKLMQRESIRPQKSGYCLFFPEFLRFLRPLERYLRWFPMGGQYFILGRKRVTTYL
ncbi:MAG: class I SAM-dependent methyltransferase [Chlamydiota bacterium]